jgi:hypothetical protein
MIGCLGPSRSTQDADVVARAVAVVALAALAVIHVVDLPGTLGPTPLVGIGYFGIIGVAVLAGAVMTVRSHWLAWTVAGGLAAAAMGGYVLTRCVRSAEGRVSSPIRVSTRRSARIGATDAVRRGRKTDGR